MIMIAARANVGTRGRVSVSYHTHMKFKKCFYLTMLSNKLEIVEFAEKERQQRS